jgi:hypothetical protein
LLRACYLTPVEQLTDRIMKALLIAITTIWLCQPPTLFVVGNIDLEALGHCQKSGCRNSPDHAGGEADHNYDHRGGTEKEYAANLRYQQQSQTELQPVIYPGELTFIVVFVILILALRIKGNVYTSIQIWYDKICRSARRSLISLRAHNSGGGRRQPGAAVSAGIRSRFISSSSAASLGSLIDLIGPGSDDDESVGGYNRRASDASNSSTDALNNSFHEVLSRSLRRRLSKNYSSGSLGTSSCDSSYYSDVSSVGMNASDDEYESDGASSDIERGDMRYWKSPDIARRRASMEAPTRKQQQATDRIRKDNMPNSKSRRRRRSHSIDAVSGDNPNITLSKFLDHLKLNSGNMGAPTIPRRRSSSNPGSVYSV